ncbi:MAG: DUF2461 domain-containing protein [Culturomica sp.]|nr:DUF2461 domain-containing protein [Culturomica sp.]
MKKVIEFLSLLRENNNREWFHANKSMYKSAEKEFNELTEQLIEEIAKFDPSVGGLTVKDCTYRIYRDIRFSPNKLPYKTHIGAYIAPKGKNSGYAGYYFHIEQSGGGFLEGNLMTSGLYMPEPKVLKSVREEIDYNGELFEENIRKATGFVLEDEAAKLKRVPKGFPLDHKYADLLKHKDYFLSKSVSNDFLLKPDLAKRAAAEFSKTVDFVKQINRAVEFAFEEE